MNNNLVTVFSSYNINILFTVVALPCRVKMNAAPLALPGQGAPSGGLIAPNPNV